jgi:hypothetical protein
MTVNALNIKPQLAANLFGVERAFAVWASGGLKQRVGFLVWGVSNHRYGLHCAIICFIEHLHNWQAAFICNHFYASFLFAVIVRVIRNLIDTPS